MVNESINNEKASPDLIQAVSFFDVNLEKQE